MKYPPRILPAVLVGSCNETHVLTTAANELQIAVLLNPSLTGVDIPEANLQALSASHKNMQG